MLTTLTKAINKKIHKKNNELKNREENIKTLKRQTLSIRPRRFTRRLSTVIDHNSPLTNNLQIGKSFS